MRPDLEGRMLRDLPNRLRVQAKNVGDDGWATAERLMLNAADTLDFLLEERYKDKNDG